MNLFRLSFLLFILKWSAGKGYYTNCNRALQIIIIVIIIKHNKDTLRLASYTSQILGYIILDKNQKQT